MNQAAHIAKKLDQWRKNRVGVVVAVDGYSGAGKTTLTNSLAAAYPWIKVIHLDDYVNTANKLGQTKEELEQLPKKKMAKIKWASADGMNRFFKTVEK